MAISLFYVALLFNIISFTFIIVMEAVMKGMNHTAQG
jgi:hypothetical protein